ncbi:LysR family transcriptional regulator [Mycetocola tolaasinivorans]|uniref:LysR family transcriptional regulator n=1 Tax=Mycetocola tolaasinivorans TaxID=76635 RepID=A0A3L7ABD6_9MICO|nr:LysR family transcriptional regulator [Mycetocola tolaasinivorans]RLP77284.1 LysR family transcriptional regulator [Mycetocola tolaasinivorans]
MSDIDPKRLAFLLAVARHGSILSASDALHVTASAVSQQISRLELEQGVALLDRGPRGVTLTPSGRILVETAESIERELLEARGRLVQAQQEVTGPVSIGAFQTVLSGLIVPHLAQLREALPGIELRLHDASTLRLPRMLRSGDADLIIFDRELDEGSPAHTRDVPLLDDPWRLVVPQATPADLGVDELIALPWLGVAAEGASARAVERTRIRLGVTSTPVHGYEDFPAALSLVAAGQGVTLLPDLALQEALPAGVSVREMPGLGTRSLTLRHRATRREPSAATSIVVDALVRLARDWQASRA